MLPTFQIANFSDDGSDSPLLSSARDVTNSSGKAFNESLLELSIESPTESPIESSIESQIDRLGDRGRNFTSPSSEHGRTIPRLNLPRRPNDPRPHSEIHRIVVSDDESNSERAESLPINGRLNIAALSSPKSLSSLSTHSCHSSSSGSSFFDFHPRTSGTSSPTSIEQDLEETFIMLKSTQQHLESMERTLTTSLSNSQSSRFVGHSELMCLPSDGLNHSPLSLRLPSAHSISSLSLSRTFDASIFSQEGTRSSHTSSQEDSFGGLLSHSSAYSEPQPTPKSSQINPGGRKDPQILSSADFISDDISNENQFDDIGRFMYTGPLSDRQNATADSSSVLTESSSSSSQTSLLTSRQNNSCDNIGLFNHHNADNLMRTQQQEFMTTENNPLDSKRFELNFNLLSEDSIDQCDIDGSLNYSLSTGRSRLLTQHCSTSRSFRLGDDRQFRIRSVPGTPDDRSDEHVSAALIKGWCIWMIVSSNAALKNRTRRN